MEKNKLKFLEVLFAHLPDGWPKPVDEDNPAESVRLFNRWGAEFDSIVHIEGYESDELDFDDAQSYYDEWGDNPSVTRDEFEQFAKEYPALKAKRAELKPANIAKIADLNQQVASLVNQITELADEVGIDVIIDLGDAGSFDPNDENWNSSNC